MPQAPHLAPVIPPGQARQTLLRCCALLMLTLSSSAPLMAMSASERIEQLVVSFERNLEHAFSAGRSALDRFRDQHTRQATILLNAQLARSSDEQDSLWLAWHLLLLNPRHPGALGAFTAAGKEAPIHEGRFAPSEPPPTPNDHDLVALVADALSPDNASVIEAARPAIQQYSRQNANAVRGFLRSLGQLRDQGHRSLVDPIAAFYFPDEAQRMGIRRNPQSVNWLTPPDRYLLEHGLLSAEVGATPPSSGSISVNDRSFHAPAQASWSFPIPLSHWRLEAVIDSEHAGEARVNAQGQSLNLRWQQGGNFSLSGPGVNSEFAAGDGSHQVHVVGSADSWYLIVNGAHVGRGTMARRPWRSISLQANSSVRSLRLRYLSANSDLLVASVGGAPGQANQAPPAPEPAADAAWLTALRAGLKEPVAFSFNNISLGEVINALNLIGPVNWHLDGSAQALVELPMFLAGEGMTGEQLLVWFNRLAGLDHRLEERGVVLTWD